MPASMISAPIGGRPKVIGSSMATVAMVPMPGNTPTRVPTSAPSRHSNMLTGIGIVKPPSKGGAHCTNWKTTPKPRERLEKRSPITPSLNQEAWLELHRQSQRVRKKEAAEGGYRDGDNQGFLPPGFRRAQRRDHEACERRNHQAQRADRERKG